MDDPVVQAIGVPLTIALVAVASAAVLPARGRSLVLGFSLCAAPLVAWCLLEGVPQFPPVQGKHKAVYLAGAAGTLGLALEAVRAGALARWLGIVGWTAAALLWIGWRRWLGGADVGFALAGLVWLMASAGVLFRLEAAGRAQGAAGVLAALLPTAAGCSGVALFGASASVSLFAAALAAASGGAALVVYLHGLRGGGFFPAGAGAAFAGGGALLALALIGVWFIPQASRLALALLALAPWASALLPPPAQSTRLARLTYPLLLLAAGAIVSGAALGVAQLQSSQSS